MIKKKPASTNVGGPHGMIEVTVSNLKPAARAFILSMFSQAHQAGRIRERAGTGNQGGSIGPPAARARPAGPSGDPDVALVIAVPTNLEMDGA